MDYKILTGDLDHIMIPAEFDGVRYEIPAMKKENEVFFRILHNTAEYYYNEIRKRRPDIRLVMDPELVMISASYCVAACHFEMADGEITETHFGETKLTPSSSQTDKDNPFKMAFKRAKTELILRELFHLPSRIFDALGNPVLYFTDETEAEQEEAVIEENSEDKKELEILGDYSVAVSNKRGETANVKLSDMSETVLKYIATFGEGEAKEKARMFYELRRKVAHDIKDKQPAAR